MKMLIFVVCILIWKYIFFLIENFVLSNRPCRPDQVRCPNSYKCIPNTARCNGVNDCRDNSDENPNQCRACNDASHFRCNNRQCIPRSYRWYI
jgi:hypothetical protein